MSDIPNDTSSKKLVPIREAADILGVSMDTIRRWDKAGILNSTRDNSGTRYFSVDELEQVKFSKPLTISEASEQLGISATTLRRLEEKGLITPKRDKDGERLYTKSSLEKFLHSEYFLRQQEVEEKILEPFNKESNEANGKATPGAGETKAAQEEHKILRSVVSDTQSHVGKLLEFRKVFYMSGMFIVTTVILVIGVIAFLFLLFPQDTAKFFGYRTRFAAKTKPNVQVLGAYATKKPESNVLGVSLKPFSRASLEVVRVVSPETYKEVMPERVIEDVNDVLSLDEKGRLTNNFTFKPPDSTYIEIPDSNLISNLNSDYVRGRIPGVKEGNLAIVGKNGRIVGLKIGREDLLPGAIPVASSSSSSSTSTPIPTPASSSSSSSSSQTATASGDIEGVGSGDGLTGGGSSGEVTLAIGDGDGIIVSSDSISVGAGSGILVGASSIAVDVATTGGTTLTSSNSGLEASAEGVRIIGGCTDGQILKWNFTAKVWECSLDAGSTGSTIAIEEGDVSISPTAATVDFLANDFTVSDSPSGEANIGIDYTNSGITRRGVAETISAGWTFGAGATITAGQTFSVNGDAFTDLTGTGLQISGGALQTTLGTSVDLTSAEVTGTLPVGSGGTGATTLTSNGVLYGQGTSAIAATSAGTSGQILLANASSVPTFVSVSGDATLAVSGALTLANAGTAGTYGSASQVPVFTTDAKGRVTAVTNTPISITGANCPTCVTTGGTLFTAAGTSGVSQTISQGDTLTIAAGTGITTTGAATDTITIASTLGASVDLATEITGTLPILNGGTNATTIGAAGTVAYSNGTNYAFTSTGSLGQCLTSSGSGAPTWSPCAAGDITAVGDVTSGDAFTQTAGNDGNTLYFEGSTPDSFETALSAADPGSDISVVIPNIAGTLASLAGTQTFTGAKTFNDITINDTSVPFTAGNVDFDVQGGATRTLSIFNSTASQVADLDLSDGSLLTAGTSRLTNAGVLQNVTYNGSTITVPFGGTGATTFTSNGVIYGNGAGALQVTGAGTSGQILQANGSGVPTFVTFSGDASVAAGGALTLSTVNSNVGTFGSATQIPQVTVDAKGRITSVANVTISGTTPGGAAGGDLSGTYPNPTVARINGATLGTTTATAGNILIGDGSSWVTRALTGDVTVSSTGVTTIGANTVALETDTTGSFVEDLTSGSGVSVTGGTGESSNPSLALGPLTANWNQTGAFDIVLNNAGSEIRLLESAGDTFIGTLDVGDLGADATYTLSGTSGTILTTGNYTGTLDSVYVNVGESPAAGDITGSFSGGLNVGADTVALGTDTTGNYVQAITAGSGLGGSSLSGEGNTADLSVNTGNGVQIVSDAITLALQANKGLEVDSNGLSIIDCATNQILKYNGAGQWVCSADDNSSSTSFADDVFRIQDNADATKQIAFEASGIASGTTRTFTAPNVSGTLITTGNLSDITATGTITSGTWNGSTVTVPFGGTGVSTFTTGGVIYGNGASALGASAQGSAGQALVSGGAGSPTWTTGTLTLAGNFATSGANSLTLTTTAGTNVTLPTTGTLATLAGVETLTNKTLTDNSTLLQDNADTTKKLAFELSGITTGTTRTLTIPNASGTIAVSASGPITLNSTSGDIACPTCMITGGTLFTLAGTSGSNQTISQGDILTIAAGAGITTTGGATDTVTIASTLGASVDLTSEVTGTLPVGNGGTGATSFTANGLLYGNTTGALQVTAAGTSGQLVVANGSGVPGFVSLSGDASLAAGGALTLSTVNSNVGTFGSATQVPQVTVDAKGRVTAVTNVTISGTTPGGAAGGDLSGTYPNPTVARINGATLGTTTATAGNILIGSGTAWETRAVTGDIAISSTGLTTIQAGAVSLTTDVANTLPVGNGGTGVTSLTTNGVLYGGSTVGVTAAGTSGQVLQANGSGVPTFVTFSGDATIAAGGALTIAANSVALEADTTGSYVEDITSGNGVAVTGGTGESSNPSFALGPLTADWSQTGAFDIALTNAASELKILESAGATFFGIVDTGDLSADRTYTLPNASGTVAVSASGPITLNSTSGDIACPTCMVSGGTLFTVAGSSGSNQTISQGDTLTIAAGAGITTTGSATDVITVASTLGTSVDLASAEVTGILPIANGGTNTSTIGSAGSVAYSNGSSYAFSGVGTAGQAIISGGAGAPTFTTGTLTLAGNFATSGSSALTLTTSGVTNATLPVGTITLADLATAQTLTNKTIGSTGLTFSGAATDITTISGEDLTLVAAGAGIINLNDTVQIAAPGAGGTTSLCF